MQRVNLDEAIAHLNELVEAAVQGETILIVSHDQQTVRTFGSAAGMFTMTDDFMRLLMILPSTPNEVCQCRPWLKPAGYGTQSLLKQAARAVTIRVQPHLCGFVTVAW